LETVAQAFLDPQDLDIAHVEHSRFPSASCVGQVERQRRPSFAHPSNA
jgi:hypothetical protein